MVVCTCFHVQAQAMRAYAAAVSKQQSTPGCWGKAETELTQHAVWCENGKRGREGVLECLKTGKQACLFSLTPSTSHPLQPGMVCGGEARQAVQR